MKYADKVLEFFGLVRAARYDQLERQMEKYRTVANNLLETTPGIIIAEDNAHVDGLILVDRKIVISPGAYNVSLTNIQMKMSLDEPCIDVC